MRTFLAIDLDPEIKDRLFQLLKKLAPLSRGVRWVRENGLHVTIKFFGETDERSREIIERVVESLCQEVPPFPLNVQGTGTFPPGSRTPRVLWAGVTADPVLFTFQKNLESHLESHGFPREERAFHPHLTLGRVKSTNGLSEVLRELDAHRNEAFGRMTVPSLTFFQSILRPSGAEYHILRQFPLR